MGARRSTPVVKAAARAAGDFGRAGDTGAIRRRGAERADRRRAIPVAPMALRYFAQARLSRREGRQQAGAAARLAGGGVSLRLAMGISSMDDMRCPHGDVDCDGAAFAGADGHAHHALADFITSRTTIFPQFLDAPPTCCASLLFRIRQSSRDFQACFDERGQMIGFTRTHGRGIYYWNGTTRRIGGRVIAGVSTSDVAMAFTPISRHLRTLSHNIAGVDRRAGYYH